jgi:hypothetical protein
MNETLAESNIFLQINDIDYLKIIISSLYLIEIGKEY